MKLLPLAKTKDLTGVYDGDFPAHWSDDWVYHLRYPIRGLYRMEKQIRPEQVAHYKRLTPNHNAVRIVEYGGKRFIWDGNHRVHARLNKGLKTICALVLTVYKRK